MEFDSEYVQLSSVQISTIFVYKSLVFQALSNQFWRLLIKKGLLYHYQNQSIDFTTFWVTQPILFGLYWGHFDYILRYYNSNLFQLIIFFHLLFFSISLVISIFINPSTPWLESYCFVEELAASILTYHEKLALNIYFFT